MLQIIEQTYEEKVKMYMKCTKKELIQMLLENQRILNLLHPVQVVLDEQEVIFEGQEHLFKEYHFQEGTNVIPYGTKLNEA